MSDVWFYAGENGPVGPLPLQGLKDRLATLGNWSSVLVWREGLSNWQSAGSIPELRPSAVPPPLPRNVSSPAKPKQGFWRNLAGVIGTVILIAIVGTLWREWRGERTVFTSLERRVREGLTKEQEEMRREFPKRIDEATTMVDMTFEGKQVTYHIVVDLNKNTLQLQPNFLTVVKAETAGKLCADTTALGGVRAGYTFVYLYKDDQDKPLGSYTLANSDCP